MGALEHQGPPRPCPRESMAWAPALQAGQSFCADLGRTACGSWRPTTSVTSSCTCRAPGAGRPHKCWRSTVLRPVPGGAGLARPPQQPVASWEGPPSSRCPTPAPPSPRLPSPHGPKLLSTRTVPRAEVQLPGQIRQNLQITRTWPRKIIRFSNQGRRQGLQHQQPGPAKALKGTGVGMGAQGLGWGRTSGSPCLRA